MTRYDRLLSLSTFSEEKLNILKNKKVLVIGTGGVGQHVLTYLLTNGILKSTIVDFDEADISNLNRQILISEEDIGKSKVNVVKKALLKKNKLSHIIAINKKVDRSNIKALLQDNFDLVVDAVDNWETKLIIAKEAKNKDVPLLHVGVDGTCGQWALFKDKSLLDLVDNSVIEEPKDGVMGPMVGLISSFASLLALKYLSGDEVEVDTLYHYDQDTEKIIKIKL
jgi:adenylyltransferase/sulfurtransferase